MSESSTKSLSLHAFKGLSQGWNSASPDQTVCELVARRKPGLALDLGAGHGGTARALMERGWQVTAIDTDRAALTTLRSIPRLTVVATDVRDYADDRSFNLVVCTWVLHFLPADDVGPMIERIKRWTAPGGSVVITVYSTRNEPGKRPYLFAPGELAAAFVGWMIELDEAKPTPWFMKPGEVNARRNHALYFVARNDR